MAIEEDLGGSITRLHSAIRAHPKQFVGASGLSNLLIEASVEAESLTNWRGEHLPPALRRLSDAEHVTSRLRTPDSDGYVFLFPILAAWAYLVLLTRAFTRSGADDLVTFWQGSVPLGIEGLPMALIATLAIVMFTSQAHKAYLEQRNRVVADYADAVARGIREFQRSSPPRSLDDASATLARAAAEIARAAESLKSFNDHADTSRQTIDGMLHGAERIASAGATLSKTADQFASASADLAPAVDRLKEQLAMLDSSGALLLEQLGRNNGSLDTLITDHARTAEVVADLSSSARELSSQMNGIKLSARQMNNLGEAMEVALRESQNTLDKVAPACTALSHASDIMSNATGRLEWVLAMLDDPDYRAESTGTRA